MNPLIEATNINVLRKKKKKRKLNPYIKKPLYAGLNMQPIKPEKLAADAMDGIADQPGLGSGAMLAMPAASSATKPLQNFTPQQTTQLPQPFGGKSMLGGGQATGGAQMPGGKAMLGGQMRAGAATGMYQAAAPAVPKAPVTMPFAGPSPAPVPPAPGAQFSGAGIGGGQFPDVQAPSGAAPAYQMSSGTQYPNMLVAPPASARLNQWAPAPPADKPLNQLEATAPQQPYSSGKLPEAAPASPAPATPDAAPSPSPSAAITARPTQARQPPTAGKVPQPAQQMPASQPLPAASKATQPAQQQQAAKPPVTAGPPSGVPITALTVPQLDAGTASAPQTPPSPEQAAAKTKPEWASRFQKQINFARSRGNKREVRRLQLMQAKKPNLERQQRQRARRQQELADIRQSRGAPQSPPAAPVRQPSDRAQFINRMVGSGTRPDGRPFLPGTERLTRQAVAAGRDDALKNVNPKQYVTEMMGKSGVFMKQAGPAWPSYPRRVLDISRKFFGGLGGMLGGGAATAGGGSHADVWHDSQRPPTQSGVYAREAFDTGKKLVHGGVQDWKDIFTKTPSQLHRSSVSARDILRNNALDKLGPAILAGDPEAVKLFQQSQQAANVGVTAAQLIPIGAAATALSGSPMLSGGGRLGTVPWLAKAPGTVIGGKLAAGAGAVSRPVLNALAKSPIGKALGPAYASLAGIPGAQTAAQFAGITAGLSLLPGGSDAPAAAASTVTPDTSAGSKPPASTWPGTPTDISESLTAPAREAASVVPPAMASAVKSPNSVASTSPLKRSVGVGLYGLTGLAGLNEWLKLRREEKQAAVWAVGDPKPADANGKLNDGTEANGGVTSYGNNAMASLDAYTSSTAMAKGKQRNKRHTKRAELIEQCRKRGWSADRTADYIYGSANMIGTAE